MAKLYTTINAGAVVTHAVQLYGPQLGFIHDNQNLGELSKT